MIETTKEVCRHCGKEYDDIHIVPEAPFRTHFCEECKEELNRVCGGSWVAAAYAASSEQSPQERGKCC